MNKQIEKAQVRLQEAKLERERRKARYDAHVTIIEGHRNNLISLEQQNEEILQVWRDSDSTVSKLSNELQILITDEHERTNETNEA